jgi:hypothetical protein
MGDRLFRREVTLSTRSPPMIGSSGRSRTAVVAGYFFLGVGTLRIKMEDDEFTTNTPGLTCVVLGTEVFVA